MRKQDELTDPKSCMSRARDDEWTFVLLGRDIAAPHAIKAWIEQRIALGKNQRHDPQIVEAERWIASVLQEQEAAVSLAAPVHYAPYGKNARGQFFCGGTEGGYTDQPSRVTCIGCKKESPGLWPSVSG